MNDTNEAKEALGSSFKELMNEKPFNKLSVNDIAQRAGLSRRAFYNHFTDKYDLANWVFETGLRRTYDQTLGSDGTYWEFQRRNIDIYEPQTAYVKNLVTNTHGVDSWRESASRLLVSLLSNHIVTHAGQSALTDEIEFYLLFFLRASLWSMIEWTAQGKPISAEELTDRIVTAMPDPLKPLLR